MDCNRVEELLSRYIENDLNTKTQNEMTAHFKHCTTCNNLLKDIKILVSETSELNEEIPFYIKNRLLYIPESIKLDKDNDDQFKYFKLIAAMLGGIILMLNIFYKTNVFPQAHYFLHKTVAKIERFAVETKSFIFQKENTDQSHILSLLDSNLFKDDEENSFFEIRDGDENG